MTATVDRTGPQAGARSGLSAAATVTADRVAGRPRIRWTHAWPVVLRPTGPQQVHLVHGAGGPLGGDALTLDVRVETGAALAVRSAGATLVQPGRGAEEARWDTTATVAAGATLDWAPEPAVVADGAVFAASWRAELAAGASVRLREIVVLGRYGQRGGRYRGRTRVTVDGVEVLAHETLLDGSDPALSGRGGTAGARAVGSLVVVGPDSSSTGSAVGAGGDEPGVRWAWTALDGPGRVLLAVGEPGAVAAVLDREAPTRQPGMTQP